MIDLKEIFDGLKGALGDGVESISGAGDDAVIGVRQSALRSALERLHAAGFNMLADLTAADYSRFGQGVPPPSVVANPAPKGCRFRLTYRLLGLDPESGMLRGRVALQCWIEDMTGPRSVRDLWKCADWLEREVWDMYGVPFSDRSDIRRILLYEEFQGHPLRKDYPINKRQPLVGPKEEKSRDRMTGGDLRPRITS